MCTVLGVARSTYYKSFDKTKSIRKIENEELKGYIKKTEAYMVLLGFIIYLVQKALKYL